MTEDIIDNEGRVKIVLDKLDKTIFVQCRDCGVPMLGIRGIEARDFCIDCEPRVKMTPPVDLSLCKGL